MAFCSFSFAPLNHQNLLLCKILNKPIINKPNFCLTTFPSPTWTLRLSIIKSNYISVSYSDSRTLIVLTKSSHFPKLTISRSHSNPNVMSKRMLNIFIATTLTFSDSISSRFSIAIAESDQELQLQRYTDSTEGFTLLIPSSWIKVEKPGATVLFQELDKGSNNIGVVVNPVKISKLSEFGTPNFVAEKLIRAEKKKESTKDAEVVAVSERLGHEGLQVYEFEYSLDSTRGGLKRVFTAAFVASKKLYLLNIANSDSLENPMDSERRDLLKQVLHSFDVSPDV